MKYENERTAALANECLEYDPSSGLLYWKKPRSNRVKCGSIAGTVNDQGYRIIVLDDNDHRAHRLAWLLVYGEWPSGEIDHRNGVRNDNRIGNLRVATRSQNVHNTRKRRNNQSGFKGVNFQPDCNKWRAAITFNGLIRHIGLFEDKADAAAAYLAEAKKLFGEFANGGGE